MRGPSPRKRASERKLCQEAKLHLAYRGFLCNIDRGQGFAPLDVSENRQGRFRDIDLLRHNGRWVNFATGRTSVAGADWKGAKVKRKRLNPMRLTDDKANSTAFQTCGTLLLRRHPGAFSL